MFKKSRFVLISVPNVTNLQSYSSGSRRVAIKLSVFGIIFSLIGVISGYAQDETLTITTYYPSPYGVYREMRAQRMAIGDNYIRGGDFDWGDEIDNNADLVVEGNVGIGTTSPTATLDVDGTVSIFGSWTSISVDTSYQAATDGFVMARGNFTAANGYIVIKTDGSNPPATTRQSKGGTATTGSNYIYSVMCPVRKGDFYKVETGSFTILAIYWLPMGG